MSTIAQEEVLLIKKLTEHATMPVRGSPLAAGFDLAAAYDIVIPAGGKGIAKTDLAMKIPTTCCK
jgi:dUTP pyrophosphatase